MSATEIDDDCESFDDRFDPARRRYRCCCRQVHATTGLRVICGMLAITVVFELWHLLVTVHAFGRNGGDSESIIVACIQFGVGVFLVTSVFQALRTERAALLLPYLLLQMLGLAAGTIFLLSFIYIAAFGDRKTAITFIRSHGHLVEYEHDKYVYYLSWMMVASFLVVNTVQVWLMQIVYASWRYYRDQAFYLKRYKDLHQVVVVNNNGRPQQRTHTSVRNCSSVDAIRMVGRNERKISKDRKTAASRNWSRTPSL